MQNSKVKLPVIGVVPVEQMVGEDIEETKLFQLAFVAAKDYLLAFNWCKRIRSAYFGDGIGGIVQVFFFGIQPAHVGVDEWLWVVIGDIPPAYLVTDNCKTPSEALEAYIQQMAKWVDLAKEGLVSRQVIPVSVKATPGEAADLEGKLNLLRQLALPRFQDAETRRS